MKSLVIKVLVLFLGCFCVSESWAGYHLLVPEIEFQVVTQDNKPIPEIDLTELLKGQKFEPINYSRYFPFPSPGGWVDRTLETILLGKTDGSGRLQVEPQKFFSRNQGKRNVFIEIFSNGAINACEEGKGYSWVHVFEKAGVATQPCFSIFTSKEWELRKIELLCRSPYIQAELDALFREAAKNCTE